MSLWEGHVEELRDKIEHIVMVDSADLCGAIDDINQLQDMIRTAMMRFNLNAPNMTRTY